jgi:6-phosphogluconolactonase (cycloisomerase 2 family)
MKRARSFPYLLSLIMTTAGGICCGGNKAAVPKFCSGCQFVYSTTDAGQILTFPVATSGALGTPTSVAGPANSAGVIAVGADLYVSDPGNNAIRVYAISSSDGSLSEAPVGPYPLSSTPSALAALVNTLYVASSKGNIFAFMVNADGSLTSIAGSPFLAGTGLSHMAIVPSETTGNTVYLYAANTNDPNGSISAFSISSNGALVPIAGSPFATVANGGPEGFYSGGRVLYVALKNANAVAALTINADGSLTPIAGSPFAAGHGTSSLDGAGSYLFAANSLDGTISSYRMQPVSGVLTEVGGSPFAAALPSGDILFSNGTLFLPDASSNSISGFGINLDGSINPLSGSPFRAGAGPLALMAEGFPVVDPIGRH